MSGLAIFGFKFPSLLQFEKRRDSESMIFRNLRTLYGVKKVPSDTCMRERLDQVGHRQLLMLLACLIDQVQHGANLSMLRAD